MRLTMKRIAGVLLLSFVAPASSSSLDRSRPSWLSKFRFSVPTRVTDNNIVSSVRGGEKDEERYSRQVYTLGARAHGLVRSSTVFIDGPVASGLVYECAKNLALSGVGSIVILINDGDDTERHYHNPQLDDLGKAYQRAARAEIGHQVPEDDATVLMEYVKRLNPSVAVSVTSRSKIDQQEHNGRGALLSVDRPHSTQVTLNNLCRGHDLAFVAVETAGVYGRVFCDFGPSFQVVDANGETPLVVPLDHVEPIAKEDDLLEVHCIEGEMHDVSKGDIIQFQSRSGESMSLNCTVVKVLNPRLITVRCTLNDETVSLEAIIKQVNEQATSFSRMKVPVAVDFLPLQQAQELARHDESLFTPCDLEKSFDTARRGSLVSCFVALDEFTRKHERLPSKADVVEFDELARTHLPQPQEDDASIPSTRRAFCQTCAGKLTPIQAILGAIGSQEALKAVSGLYSPIRQFLLYDCDELLVETDYEDMEDCDSSGQSYILGQTISDALANRRLFVVGAGAIGCELLKNLAAMGSATGKGHIVVTDMDTIEKSNLSRQLLFRDSDIGKFKSYAAQEAIQRFRPGMRVEVHTSKVGDGEYGPFDNEFWAKKVDTVFNALDNMEARLYMDGQCVAHQKSLIDAGTLGSKGNVQVVIPHLSESYGSSVDPPEPSIPVCTLKNFPYAISHTIQWGRDLFDGCFQRRPKQANDYVATFRKLDVDEFAKSLVETLGEEQAREVANELREDWALSGESDAASIRASCIEWAADYAMKLFHDTIEELLRQHPTDSVDEDGDPFWSGARKVPKALKYVASDELDDNQFMINTNLVDFVRYAARLRFEMVGGLSKGESAVSVDEAIGALQKDRNDDSTDGQIDALEEARAWHMSEDVEARRMDLTPAEDLALRVTEFEKDDEANGHVAFVTAASNLRALCYGIAPVDAMETRRVAGRIVPALISTTAFVSALSCVELFKLLQGAPLERHRNAFINLALPFFAYTAPVPAEQVSGVQGTTFTLWDRITVKEGKKSSAKGGITLRGFIQRIAKKSSVSSDSLSISTVSYGPYMIYSSFLHEDDNEMLRRPVFELIKEAIRASDDEEFAGRDEVADILPEQQLAALENSDFVDFTVVVEDIETGEEFELPPVRLVKATDV